MVFRSCCLACSVICSVLLSYLYRKWTRRVFVRTDGILLRRWADKFCLHCNIFIYITHIWIKPVPCSRMVSLFRYTSLWTHRYLQSSSSAHWNGRGFRSSVQTACCYWIVNRGKSSSNWNSQESANRFCDQRVDVSTVRQRVRRFKDGELGHTDLSDKTRSGRTVTARDQLHQDRVEELIRVLNL